MKICIAVGRRLRVEFHINVLCEMHGTIEYLPYAPLADFGFGPPKGMT